MMRIRQEAEARGLTESELIQQLEAGRLPASAVFPALKDQLAFESWIEERAAAERTAGAVEAARELVKLVYEIESDRHVAPRGFRVRVNHAMRSFGAAAAHLLGALRAPSPPDRESLSRLTPAGALRQGLASSC